MTPEEIQAQETAKAEQEKKDAEAAKLKAEADTKAENEMKAKENDKVGNLFKKERKDKEGKVVPEAVFLEEKKARKELERKLKELEESGATKKEVNDSLKEIAEKYDVDEEVISAIAYAVNKEADAKIDEKISSKMKPIEEKEQREKVNAIFEEHYEKTLAENPEYKSVANKAVIKSLTLDPANAEKTFAQIFQEAYGHLVKPKKPLEKVRPKDGGAQATIDFNRAKTDKAYYDEIMADPTLKAEYNKDLHKRLKL